MVQGVLAQQRRNSSCSGPAMDGVKKRNMDKLQTSLVVSRTKGTSAGDENLTYELPTTGNQGMDEKAIASGPKTTTSARVDAKSMGASLSKIKVHAVDGREGDRKKFYHESVFANKTTVNESDRYDTFLTWLNENNASFPDQYLKKYSDGVRGVHADRDIPADKQIATVPLKLLIHEGMGQETEYGRRVHNTKNNIIVPNHTQVIIYLLSTGARYWAKPNGKCTSFFKPYYIYSQEPSTLSPYFGLRRNCPGLKARPWYSKFRTGSTTYSTTIMRCVEYARSSVRNLAKKTFCGVEPPSEVETLAYQSMA